MKNILLIGIATAIVVTAIEISFQSKSKATVPTVQKTNSTGSADRKLQIEQAKKNSVLKRFVS